MKNCSNLWIYHQLHKTKGEAIIVRKNIPKFNKEKGQIDLLNVFSKKTAKPIQSFCTGLFLVNLEHFQYINLVFLLFILNMNFFIVNCLETFVQAFFRNNSHRWPVIIPNIDWFTVIFVFIATSLNKFIFSLVHL